jgi:hypothetical protein
VLAEEDDEVIATYLDLLDEMDGGAPDGQGHPGDQYHQ